MKNPWLKKNPLMSMWMSGANAVFGAARGRANAEARRQATTMMSEIDLSGSVPAYRIALSVALLEVDFASFCWRMGWDSNPRRTFALAGFQVRCIQPLCHPSIP